MNRKQIINIFLFDNDESVEIKSTWKDSWRKAEDSQIQEKADNSKKSTEKTH